VCDILKDKDKEATTSTSGELLASGGGGDKCGAEIFFKKNCVSKYIYIFN